MQWLALAAVVGLGWYVYTYRKNGFAPKMIGPMGVREQAIRLIHYAVPSVKGGPIFSEVTRDYGGIGTPCGYLVSWLLYRLGKTEQVNRTSERTKYVVGRNMAAIVANPAFVKWESRDHEPKPGDILFLSNGPPATEHGSVVFKWKAGPGGVVTADYGREGGSFTSRTLVEGDKLFRPDIADTRKIVGFIDIERAR